MARDREGPQPVTTEDVDNQDATDRDAGRRLRTTLIIGATFAAGAGAALATKSVLKSRRDGGAKTPVRGADPAAGEDLPTVLRRAALDLAIAATNEAAERLSGEEPSKAGSAQHS